MSDPVEATRRLEALVQAGLTLASELSLPVVLQKIIDVACEVADARYGALGVIGEDGTLSDFITHGVTEEERRRIGRLPEGHGILGVLIREARPLRLRHLQEHPQSYGYPPEHPHMTSFLGVPIKVRDRVFGNLYLTEKIGVEEFTEDDEGAVVTLATQAAVAIENARLYQDAQANQMRLAAVNQVTEAILGGEDVERVLMLVAGYARELVGASLASIATPHPDGDDLILTVAVGSEADRLRGMRFSRDGSISGEVMTTGQAVVLEDATGHPNVYQPIVQLGSIGPAMFVPLGANERLFGTLSVANTRGGRRFGVEDLALVQLFATQAAVGLEYARVRGELERFAIIEDRERIAKELHDGVVQSLFAVGMSLQAADAMAADPDEVRKRLSAAVGDIDRAIRDLRNYIFALRPGEMADRQLVASLRDLAERFGGGGVRIEVEVEPGAAAHLSVRAADLVQAAREALSNAVRHSGSEFVRLSLTLDDGQAVLEIIDRGAGFDPRQVMGTGHGLGNLADRAASMGGDLTIRSRPGEGTTVRIEIPL